MISYLPVAATTPLATAGVKLGELALIAAGIVALIAGPVRRAFTRRPR